MRDTMTTLTRSVAILVGIRLLGSTKKVLIATTPITGGASLACVAFLDTIIARCVAFWSYHQAAINLELVESPIFVWFFATRCADGQNEYDKNEHRRGFECCHPICSFMLIEFFAGN